jgi:hypothetical protein
MRELYLVACGLVIGLSVRDWLEARERRIAYRAADLAEENFERRRRWEAQNPQPVEPAPATPAAT